MQEQFPQTNYEKILMGHIGYNKKATTIFVGSLNCKRVWGYIPKSFEEDREKIIKLITGDQKSKLVEFDDLQKIDIKDFFRGLGGN